MEITNKRFSVKIALFAKFNEIIQREKNTNAVVYFHYFISDMPTFVI